MLRLHPAGYAQHERTSKPARPERSEAKSKGEQGVFTTHLKKEPYSGEMVIASHPPSIKALLDEVVGLATKG